MQLNQDPRVVMNLFFVCILVDGSVEGKKLYNGTRRTASGRGKWCIIIYDKNLIQFFT